MQLKLVRPNEIALAYSIIEMAKKHLKQQGIDQWQNGYPNIDCIKNDVKNKKGFFVVEGDEVLGYLCVDFDGEPAYRALKGQWTTGENYVVVHRMAFCDNVRGKGLADKVFKLVEEMSKQKGVDFIRIDTDADNKKMRHILQKNGFEYCGTICFDNSEKIAFDKTIK